MAGWGGAALALRPVAARPLRRPPGPAARPEGQPTGRLAARRAHVWALAAFPGPSGGGTERAAGPGCPERRGPRREGAQAVAVRDFPSPVNAGRDNPGAAPEAPTGSQPSLGSLACKR